MPGVTRQRIGTCPRTATISLASSGHASSPATSLLSASVTRTCPPSVVNVVSSTLVPGRYRRSARYGTAGQMVKLPPVSGSSRAANTGGASIAGTAHQSIAPSAATSASDRPSPMTP